MQLLFILNIVIAGQETGFRDKQFDEIKKAICQKVSFPWIGSLRGFFSCIFLPFLSNGFVKLLKSFVYVIAGRNILLLICGGYVLEG